MKALGCGLLCLFCMLCGCGGPSHQPYSVGVDPAWYPLEFDNDMNRNLTAFSTDLLAAIGVAENIAFTKMTTRWDTLMQGLQKGSYDAILCSMPPYLFNQKLFHFSSIYLHLGPVMVVPSSSPLKDIENLEGKEIAVIKGSSDDLLLEKKPGVLIRYYDSAPEALNALLAQTVDGALIDTLTASAFLKELYQHKLKAITPPLTEEGLRLITKYQTSEEIVKRFNAGLKKIQKSGEYDKLLQKWGLGAVPPSSENL